MIDTETCSWCTTEVPWSTIKNHETADGALLCRDDWQEYLSEKGQP